MLTTDCDISWRLCHYHCRHASVSKTRSVPSSWTLYLTLPHVICC